MRTRGTPIPLVPFAVVIGSIWLFAIGSGSAVDAESAPVRLGLAVITLSWVPFALRKTAMRAGKEVRPVPFLEAVCILYGVYFGLPGLLDPGDNSVAALVSGEDRVSALSLSWAGLIAMLVGVYLVGAILPTVLLRPIRLGESQPVQSGRMRTEKLAVMVLGFGLVMDFVRTRGMGTGFGQIVPLLGQLAEVGMATLLILALDHRLTPRSKVVGLIGGFLYLFLRVGEGSIAQAVFPVVALCFVVWAVGRRVPLWALASLVFLVIVLRSNADRFRTETWVEGASGPTSLARSERFVQLAKESVEAGETSAAVEIVLERMNQSAMLGYVISQTPEAIPYWDGETYRTVFGSFVPRVLWPDKPSKFVGQEFGHRYEILASSDQTTSINLPLLVELFANYGRDGVLLGMLILGALYRWLMDLLNRRGMGRGMTVVAAIVMSRMLNIESDFSLTFGALPFQIVTLLLVTRWIFEDPSQKDGRSRRVDIACEPGVRRLEVAR